MKVLALNYDNPFVDPQAVENIDNMADILKVDVIRYTLKNKIHERTFRSNLLAWAEKTLSRARYRCSALPVKTIFPR